MEIPAPIRPFFEKKTSLSWWNSLLIIQLSSKYNKTLLLIEPPSYRLEKCFPKRAVIWKVFIFFFEKDVINKRNLILKQKCLPWKENCYFKKCFLWKNEIDISKGTSYKQGWLRWKDASHAMSFRRSFKRCCQRKFFFQRISSLEGNSLFGNNISGAARSPRNWLRKTTEQRIHGDLSLRFLRAIF